MSRFFSQSKRGRRGGGDTRNGNGRSTLLGTQPHSGDKPLEILVVYPHRRDCGSKRVNGECRVGMFPLTHRAASAFSRCCLEKVRLESYHTCLCSKYIPSAYVRVQSVASDTIFPSEV